MNINEFKKGLRKLLIKHNCHISAYGDGDEITVKGNERDSHEHTLITNSYSLHDYDLQD